MGDIANPSDGTSSANRLVEIGWRAECRSRTGETPNQGNSGKTAATSQLIGLRLGSESRIGSQADILPGLPLNQRKVKSVFYPKTNETTLPAIALTTVKIMVSVDLFVYAFIIGILLLIIFIYLMLRRTVLGFREGFEDSRR